MRKLHIQQFLELVKTLDAACAELDKQKNNNLLNLYAEIQEFVSGMFDYVESALGKDKQLLEWLRELYEMLYYASQGKMSVMQIIKAVHKIKTAAVSLKADKIEVVFFCYKASMSDSLESVYFAAKEDPACDAYFVPIPYFDRNPDGSFGQMHFEGIGYYSERYELSDWQKYDVQVRRPDVIFIMNPYDEQNYVTSVHPNFYSRYLKEYTDMLVYIEYGLTYWLCRDPFTKEVQEEFKKSVLLPAHLYSHYDIRYAKELAEAHEPMFAAHPKIAQQFHMTPEKVREKFIPLGSPKFDKILNSTRNDYPLPKEWKRKAEGKKIILYNTGLAELLKSSAQQMESLGHYASCNCWYFEKLRSIIEAFQEHSEVILWWRPHPLFETTLRSMRPALLQEYLKIVYDVKRMDNGIFDETENLHRAMAWSDGMISDESSLLLLYTATGKPFYIPSITKALSQPIYDNGTDFHAPLAGRLENMRSAKGANVGDWNCCIWWDNFLEEDVMRNTHFNHYTKRFIDFIVYREQYAEAEEYQQLQMQMVRDFVVNADGTAGQKIYAFVKQKTLGKNERGSYEGENYTRNQRDYADL